MPLFTLPLPSPAPSLLPPPPPPPPLAARTDIDLLDLEVGVLGAEPDVGGRDQIDATTDTAAMDGRDHRLTTLVGTNGQGRTLHGVTWLSRAPLGAGNTFCWDSPRLKTRPLNMS